MSSNFAAGELYLVDLPMLESVTVGVESFCMAPYVEIRSIDEFLVSLRL